MNGLKTAILYGIYPHNLGFCGPEKNSQSFLKNYLLGEEKDISKIKNLLRQFKAAYSYYQLIASANKIKNPFDKKVVEAYWLGNSLLEKISYNSLKKMILDDFVKNYSFSLRRAKRIISSFPPKVLPNHLFHILFIGSLSGKIKINTFNINLCRISWGLVKEIKKDKIICETEELKKNFWGYSFKKPRLKEFFLDRKIVFGIKPGKWVSLHWNWIVEVLNKEKLLNLKKYTFLVLKLYEKSLAQK